MTSQLSIPETLNESISETLKRDFRRIFHKILYVILPRCSANKEIELKNWDLWGPLLLILCYCM